MQIRWIFVFLLLPLCAFAAEEGSAAPDFTVAGENESSYSLRKFRGHYLYLDFWASWCAPCRQSFPWMNSLREKFSARGLQILAVSVDQDRADAENFLKERSATFNVGFDPRGETVAKFAPPGMPTSYLIDPSGKVMKVFKGFSRATEELIEDHIGHILRER